MLTELSEREKLLLRVALVYSHANVDEINEAFKAEGREDEILVRDAGTGVHQLSADVTAEELNSLCLKLTDRGAG